MLTTPVKIYHNVACECRGCGQPVTENGNTVTAADGSATCSKSPEGGPHSAGLVPFSGYQHGHPVVLVWTGEWPSVDTPDVIAEEAFEAFNIGGRFAEQEATYRARKLRSLSVGDIVVVGEVALQCAVVGFEAVDSGRINILDTWPGTSVTVILPH